MAAIAVVGEGTAATATALRRSLPRPGPSVVRVRTSRGLRRLLGTRLLDTVVVTPQGGGAPLLRELRDAHPTLPLAAAGPFRPDDGALLLACREAGALVLVEGVDDAVMGELVMRRTFAARRRAALADAPRALRLEDPVQRAVWELVVTEVERPLRTAEIAKRLGLSREHLSRQFGAGGAPNLKRVIDLARVACAAQLLVSPSLGPREVAGLLHFASPSHLAATTRRVAGVAPGALAALGPAGVLEAFAGGRTRSRL